MVLLEATEETCFLAFAASKGCWIPGLVNIFHLLSSMLAITSLRPLFPFSYLLFWFSPHCSGFRTCNFAQQRSHTLWCQWWRDGKQKHDTPAHPSQGGTSGSLVHPPLGYTQRRSKAHRFLPSPSSYDMESPFPCQSSLPESQVVQKVELRYRVS